MINLPKSARAKLYLSMVDCLQEGGANNAHAIADAIAFSDPDAPVSLVASTADAIEDVLWDHRDEPAVILDLSALETYGRVAVQRAASINNLTNIGGSRFASDPDKPKAKVVVVDGDLIANFYE